MSLRTLFAEIFGPAWTDAETLGERALEAATADLHAVEHEAAAIAGTVDQAATNLIHRAEKEFAMLPQETIDVIARIKAMITGATDQSVADGKTIAALQSDKAALTAQSADLTQQLAARTQERDDAVSQLAELEQQLLAIAPAPAQ